ncbi:extracellular solute-binding protein [Candidatus Parcubacteria bacterium]|nr:extracellular solute-binding protein [Candidatus Parcubacteria bacterium]
MSKFQIGLLVVFGVFILLAVILFSTNRGSSVDGAKLSVWGTLSEYDFNNMITNSGLGRSDTLSFSYTEKPEGKLSADFTEALAEGNGPDLIILPLENLLKDKNKLMLIPNASVKPSDFVSTFIKEGELFETAEGTYALPMYIDPMVLYWNRDLFAKASLATPPVYWDQIYDYISKLTVRDNAGNITQSAIALGEAKNIPHAKEVLSLLMLQAGTPIVIDSGIGLRAGLIDSFGQSVIPAQAALDFYTQFANPQKSFYGWNRSLVTADTHFASGKSAMYLGFASERPVLKAKNPTADIAVAPVPQSRVSSKVITFGRIYGVAIARSARDGAAALSGVLALASKESAAALSGATPLVPARRDLLSQKPVDPFGSVFYGAALQARGWLDPDSDKSQKIFTDMIESVTSGRQRVEEAVRTAQSALDALLSK